MNRKKCMPSMLLECCEKETMSHIRIIRDLDGFWRWDWSVSDIWRLPLWTKDMLQWLWTMWWWNKVKISKVVWLSGAKQSACLKGSACFGKGFYTECPLWCKVCELNVQPSLYTISQCQKLFTWAMDTWGLWGYSRIQCNKALALAKVWESRISSSFF